MIMDLELLCHKLPKIELHAHLNGSLSKSTMLELQRYHVDSGIVDSTNSFLDEFQIGAGDTRALSECFQVFGAAHVLTRTAGALALATSRTLREFRDDGCCYVELRSTPRRTDFLSELQYVETIVEAMRKCSTELAMTSRLVVSVNRSGSAVDAQRIADVAAECRARHPDVVVGLELSGDPTLGRFRDFEPALRRARAAGLKISLHCGEVCNPQEIVEMLRFNPDRIGHGVCIHPRLGGTDETWSMLCQSKIPVELCLTSNVRTKSIPCYESHHFKEFYDAGIPIVLCTDDKGVFATSLSQEYRLCAETYSLTATDLVDLASNAAKFIFADEESNKIKDKIMRFKNENNL